jgi:hypothetical protein
MSKEQVRLEDEEAPRCSCRNEGRIAKRLVPSINMAPSAVHPPCEAPRYRCTPCDLVFCDRCINATMTGHCVLGGGDVADIFQAFGCAVTPL